MKRFFLMCLLFGGLIQYGGSSSASPIDFSAWSSMDWSFSPDFAPARWETSGAHGPYLHQSNTGGPSVYLNNLSQTDYQVKGSFRVCTTAPFGIIGFVFGYQDAGHFYLLDWRRFNWPSVGKDGIGLAIRKFSAPSLSDLDLSDFQSSTSTEYMDVLALNYGPYCRWSPFTKYDFFLDYKPGSFHVSITNANTFSVIWDVVVNDSSYAYGRFGIYNFCQGGGQYSSFEQKGGSPEPNSETSPVPEPTGLLLIGAGLLAMAGRLRKCGAGRTC